MEKLKSAFWAMEPCDRNETQILEIDEQRHLLSQCEDNQTEVLEDIYTAYVSLLEAGDQEYCYKTYWLTPDSHITLKGTDKLISMGTTGLQTWPAGLHLAEYLIENKEKVSKKHVIELGSGLGLTGITVVKYTAPTKYVFSDCHPVVLTLLQENVTLNLPDDHHVVCVKTIDWTDNDAIDVSDDFDLMLAADVVYDPDIIVHLVQTLAACIRRPDKQAVALVASTVRNSDTYTQFELCLGHYGLQSKLMMPPTKQLFQYDRSVPIKILQIFATI
ncbi:protein-lysine N-methyltransferase EEF2KMT-like isoform X2 [Corticium candelabrum]|uniref:protein-lysine N-methyltransferase EEF2KMT-like isoform X2 n=1 Tax=Corticium candelabrum TaxID=121492 RepID=UPI002E36FB0E|nr:protein-lysine N-methyltransferase EEF2KMT-like isoform X2 [Corticium candelabrum]